MTHCRLRGRLPAASAPPLEDDDLLQEILLRLPPQPSSLTRASAVCRQWRSLATDLKFIARFRAHHRKPPLVGVFRRSSEGILFVPVLDPPDRIPTLHIDLPRIGYYDVLSCRHGHFLAMDRWSGKLLVCDPITRKQRHVVAPPQFRRYYVNAAVLCPAADEQGHVHGGCPFKVVLVTMYADRPVACVYSSETGIWGDLVKTAAPCELDATGFPGTLVGNVLYWLQHKMGDDILVFDLAEHSLTMIRGPPITNGFPHGSGRIIRAENGAVGLAILSYPHFQMWQRNINSHGVATWELWKAIEMHTILGLPQNVTKGKIVGYSEDTDAFFIFLKDNVYMVQLKLMQSKKLRETEYIHKYHPFTSFYIPGIAIGGGNGEAELHNTFDDSLV